ncbi:MAG: hypothetical protein M1830_010435 [Pleopsidium flavum]|nr:MAG: hypothetical protein M1830_010435 [Pleopsidium flavum]
MAENVPLSLPSSPHLGKESLWRRSRKILDAKQITFLQPLLKTPQDKSTKQGKQSSGSAAADPSRRREQVRSAQRTHRQRTQNYMKALEQEVVRLREVETQMIRQNEALQGRVNALERTLFMNAIPAPPDMDANIDSVVDDFLRGQTAKVTLRNDGVDGERLHVHMPSPALEVSPNQGQRANASVFESQVLDSSDSNGFTNSYKHDAQSPMLADATVIPKEWLDSDALASPQLGIEFVLA